ncbi:PREDICTED: LOW QUALITY PROTEIN: proline rich 19 [Elephantulus edwardii]|uniref:LOW QUALITY PROTEIN: proline rich 19 n=1 Tax=Elephantulus edwardii TaxID=28737 RepID=UPI0003F06C39|nr:PREDICTED: LOW QUALITY PROTEIN: proline rich 19 [Elephantulus edwardii]
MDPWKPASQPLQQHPEKPGRIRRRKTRRERNEALVGSRRPKVHQDPPVASQEPAVTHRKPTVASQNPVAPAAHKLVVITQGRLSREHWGLFSHEVKSLDVARLLSSRAVEPDTPLLPTKPSPLQGSTQESSPQLRGKENQLPENLCPGPPSPPNLPCLSQLLWELQFKLILPQAFSRRNLVQEARDIIVGTLQACHGHVPDLTLVLQGQPHLPGEPTSFPCTPLPLACSGLAATHTSFSVPEVKTRNPERRKMTPSWISSVKKVPGEGWKRRLQSVKEPAFTMAPASNSSIAHKASLGPAVGSRPLPIPSVTSPSEAAWGPPTAFDLLKSIWLAATPPPSRPWGIGLSHPMPPPPSPLLLRSSALEWSPSPPAPLPSLSWVVAQNSPEAWSFPPMRLY